MDLDQLLHALAQPSAYPEAVQSVELRQTHISAVFLTKDFVYKLKKPVNLGFVDYSTLAHRQHFCEVEVRENSPLAPEVYLGVVPVTQSGDRLAFEGEGEVVDYAVKMRRLPDDAHLAARLEAGEDLRGCLTQLVEQLTAFYARPEQDPPALDLSGDQCFERVERNALENFEQTASHVGTTVSGSVFERVQALTRSALLDLAPLMRLRAQPFTRLTHGDLRLDHVYRLPGRPQGRDLAVIDCIEFNDRFRIADVVSDLAFLAMDLIAHGARSVADFLIQEYQRVAKDKTSRSLFGFFIAYRSVVRAKVRGISLSEPELSDAERSKALTRAQGHWLLALDQLETPARRPGLVLVGGLPGTGKSTLAFHLATTAGFVVLRSDLIRKELAGVAQQPSSIGFGEGIYTPEWSQRTYAECLRRAEALLIDGQRVIIDANFGRSIDREQALGLARRLGVRSLLLVRQSAPETIRERLRARVGDASDADWSIYQEAARRWEPTGPEACLLGEEPNLDRAVLERLAEAGLL